LSEYALDWAAATIGIFIGVVAMGVMFLASVILAPRRPSQEKGIPFESFFFFFFFFFDVEAVFLFPWAIVFMEIKAQAGVAFTHAVANAVFYEMGIFVAILGFGVAYAWRKGVLQWR